MNGAVVDGFRLLSATARAGQALAGNPAQVGAWAALWFGRRLDMAAGFDRPFSRCMLALPTDAE
jgi:hypothetical protein